MHHVNGFGVSRGHLPKHGGILKGLSKVELLILQNSTGQRLVSWGISFVSPSLTPAFLQHIKAAEHISVRNQDIQQKDHMEAMIQIQRGGGPGVLQFSESPFEVKALAAPAWRCR